MIKEIKYGGYTATPSDYECPDGELSAAINLVPEEEGMLKVVGMADELGQLSSGEETDSDSQTYSYKFRLLFVHKNSTYRHLILVKEKYYEGDTDFYCQLYWLNCSNEGNVSDALSEALSGSYSPTSIANSYTCASGKSLSVSAIGNTLVVTGAKDGTMHYVLWKDSTYKYLGNHLPEIYLSFSLSGHVDYQTPTGSYSFDNSLLNLSSSASAGSYYKQIISYAASLISDSIMGLVIEKGKAIIDSGYFIHPFFVRYALRLYDGSLTMHSAPILMNPCTTCNPFVYASSATQSSVKVVAMFVKADLECQLLNAISDTSYLENWNDIITGVDIFVSNQMCPFDQDGNITEIETTTETANASSSSGRSGRTYGFGNTAIKDSVFVGTFGTSGKYAQYKYTHIYGWNPRAKDSSGSGVYQQDAADENDIEGGSFPKYAFALPELEDGQIKETIENASDFRYLYSIPISDISNYTTRTKIDIPVTMTNNISWGTGKRKEEASTSQLTSLMGEEVMTDDYHSHDIISPRSVLDYNERLNLAGIKRTLFNGFPLSSMLAYCNTRYNYVVAEGAGGGARPQSSTHGEFHYFDSSDKYIVVVYLKVNGEDKEVVCTLDNYGLWLQNILSDNDSNSTPQNDSWGSYFYYPDRNAYKMRIIHKGNAYHAQGDYLDIQLTEHNDLNGAYAFVDYNTVRELSGHLDSLPDSSSVVVDELGKIYTSDASNPFVFSTTSINTVGTGDILGISVATKALSQGQFGQFPLYAFTSDGVWALEVSSSTGSFSAIHPLSRDVCINPKSITQLDNSVIFTTDRGIMLLSGSNTICISDSINSSDILKVADLKGLNNITGNSTITTAGELVPFMEFVAEARMLYDYTHQHIIVYNPTYSYAYVYSLKSKQWGMMQADIQEGLNSYPECLAVTKSNEIVNFSKEGSTDDDEEDAATEHRNALLVTRPLKLDHPDVMKTIDTIIQRGKFHKGDIQSILYGSRDLQNWFPVWSSVDHYLRGFRGTPYKFFRVVLLCSLNKKDSIFGSTIQFTPRLIDKLR